MAAGVLYFDGSHRLLVLKPTYRDGWVTPGGVVDADETPLTAARREVAEELGNDFGVGRLLAVDHVSAIQDYPEGLMFQFLGGALSEDDIGRIRLPADELSAMRFVETEEAFSVLLPRLGPREVIAGCYAGWEHLVS